MGLLQYIVTFAIQLKCFTALAEGSSQRQVGDFPMTSETNLTNDLLQRYHIHGVESLPLRNMSTKLTLWFGMRLVKMDIDEKSQTLSTSVWIRMRWVDEVLQWYPEDYGGVKSVMLPRDKIWTPDTVTVTNTFSTAVEDRQVLLKVFHTGAVLWFPLRKFSSECLLDLADYPYDVHTCTLWVQSLSWPSSQLDLQPYKFNNNNPWDLDTFLESYRVSQPWEIIGNGTERVKIPRESVILMWSKRVALKFTLTLKRRPTFISYLLRFPVVILSFMAILIFCLPPERPDRHMFAMSLFASFMILLLVLVDKVPPTAASIPKLIYVYCANLCVVIVCISCSVLVIHVTRRGSTGHTPPKCLQKVFFEVLAKVLFIHPGRLSQIEYNTSYSNNKQPMGNSPLSDVKDSAYNMEDNSESEKQQIVEGYARNADQKREESSAKHKGTGNAADKQWKLIALMLDRIFAVVFLISNVAVVALLFPRG